MIVVEGLDLSGKTVVAQYLADSLELSYEKVNKGELYDYSEELDEAYRTVKILDEMVSVIEDDNIVLDRGIHSTIATGKLYDPDLDYNRMIQQAPEELVPDTGILITCSPSTIEKRKEEVELTEQDKEILSRDYFQIQEHMTELAEDYIHIQNDFDTIEELYSYIDDYVLPQIKAEL